MIQDLFYAIFKTPSGWMGILGSPAGLVRITLPQPSEVKAISLLGDNLNRAKPSASRFNDLIKRFQTYFSGHKADFPDILDLSEATSFQREVWEIARRIPYGQTRSYAWVAGQIGKPEAARAVGQALGKNPLPIIIPCHRVLGSNGSLGGYSGGLEMKKYLLTLEKKADAE
jgi:methylated-DNA-[protein]-cysteine S-methyltransferase